jgi:guanylate kinase
MASNQRRRGLMFILSSPSGAGKTTISRKLLAADEQLRMSVSVTTRPQRPGEVAGKDYIFAETEEFERMVEDDAFLEWAVVFGHRYGTPRAQIAEGLEAGEDFLFDIDWQGAQQLSQRAGKDVVSVFLLPPSIAELEARLRSRGTDSEDVIAGRMDRARSEISHWDGYDYVVINDDIDACFAKVHTILEAERLRRTRQTGLIEFVRDLTA